MDKSTTNGHCVDNERDIWPIPIAALAKLGKLGGQMSASGTQGHQARPRELAVEPEVVSSTPA